MTKETIFGHFAKAVVGQNDENCRVNFKVSKSMDHVPNLLHRLSSLHLTSKSSFVDDRQYARSTIVLKSAFLCVRSLDDSLV